MIVIVYDYTYDYIAREVWLNAKEIALKNEADSFQQIWNVENIR